MAEASHGSHCAQHTAAPAVALCPRCGDMACAQCWSEPTGLCDLCAHRDPFYHVPTVPWERAELSFGRRLLGTFGALLRPWSKASAFARGTPRDAARFALVVSLPLSCLATIIPVTRTLLFVPSRVIQLQGEPSTLDIILDVLRAMALGPVLTLVYLLPVLVGTLFGSLFRQRTIWLRAVLYWSWLQPLTLLGTYLFGWLSTYLAWLSLALWPLVLLWWISHFYVARRAVRASVLVTLLTVFFASAAAVIGLSLSLGLLSVLAPGVSGDPS